MGKSRLWHEFVRRLEHLGEPLDKLIGRGDPQPPAQVRDAAFAAPLPEGKPVYQALAMDEGGAAILAVLSAKPGTPGANPANDQQLMSRAIERIRDAVTHAADDRDQPGQKQRRQGGREIESERGHPPCRPARHGA